MNLSFLGQGDMAQTKELYDQFFSQEFDFPDFQRFLFSLVVRDGHGKVITAGGVRTLAESIIITDKNYPIEGRLAALKEMQGAQAYLAQQVGYDQLHAFIQDEKWLAHLKKHGFKDCIGKALYLPLF